MLPEYDHYYEWRCIMFEIRSFLKLLFISLLCLTPMWLYSQEDEGEVFILSERVGDVIDLEERNFFILFQGIKGFKSAVVFKKSDNSYVIKVTYINQNTGEEIVRKISESDSQIKNICEYIDHFNISESEIQKSILLAEEYISGQSATIPSDQKKLSIKLSHTPSKGLFLGFGWVRLMMNGRGEANFSVTKNLLDMSIIETPWGVGIAIEYEGWGWKNNSITGFSPIIGYKFSPQFSIIGLFSFLREKESRQYDSYILNPIYLSNASNMTYSQNELQIIGRFYPTKGSGFFISGGIKLIYVNTKLSYQITINDYRFIPSTSHHKWKANGKTIVHGLDTGIGYEFNLSDNLSIIPTVSYSYAISGDPFLSKIGDHWNFKYPGKIRRLHIGGLSTNFSFIFYLTK